MQGALRACYYPRMEIEVVVEIPKGTRNKYEADSQGTIWLDRMLFTATAGLDFFLNPRFGDVAEREENNRSRQE